MKVEMKKYWRKTNLYAPFILLLLLGILGGAGCSSPEPLVSQTNPYFSLSDSSTDTLFKIPKTGTDGSNEAFGFVNQRGDTIVSFGQFAHCFTDTITTFGIVMEEQGEDYQLVGINPQGQRLYEVFWYDNGPDYPSEGLFRVLRDGKIGYANEAGKIIIQPQFSCAYPFSEGKAKVALTCTTVTEGEYSAWESENWFHIDRTGNQVKD